MKNAIMTLALLSSVSAFAGTDNCKGLAGSYVCNYEGQAVNLGIAFKAKDSVEIKLNGVGEVTALNGVKTPSKNDHTESAGTCVADKEINIKTFAPHLVGVLNETGLVADTSITLSKTGVVYSITQYSTVSGESALKLECAKK